MSFPLIIADESVDARLISALQSANYNIYPIIFKTPGISDTEVIEMAAFKQAYIITEDKDFGDEIVFKKAAHKGTLLLRIQDLKIEERINLVINILSKYNQDLLNNFGVLTSKKLRIRH